MIIIKKNKPSQDGFTLLEIIITLIVASIFSAMIVQFLSTGMRQSGKPVIMIMQSFSINEIMEKITSDYDKLMDSDPPLDNLLETFKNYVMNGNNPGAVLPYTYYGDYSMVIKYIDFGITGTENSASCASECKYLKISISKDNNTLTSIFTR